MKRSALKLWILLAAAAGMAAGLFAQRLEQRRYA